MEPIGGSILFHVPERHHWVRPGAVVAKGGGVGWGGVVAQIVRQKVVKMTYAKKRKKS